MLVEKVVEFLEDQDPNQWFTARQIFHALREDGDRSPEGSITQATYKAEKRDLITSRWSCHLSPSRGLVHCKEYHRRGGVIGQRN